jgi:addiction module RelE/StbE family toxin
VIRAIWDEGFKRSYKKRVKKNEELRGPQLRTHKLTGKLEGLWAFSVDDDYRVVFEFIGQDKVLLIDIGSHDEVY